MHWKWHRLLTICHENFLNSWALSLWTNNYMKDIWIDFSAIRKYFRIVIMQPIEQKTRIQFMPPYVFCMVALSANRTIWAWTTNFTAAKKITKLIFFCYLLFWIHWLFFTVPNRFYRHRKNPSSSRARFEFTDREPSSPDACFVVNLE